MCIRDSYKCSEKELGDEQCEKCMTKRTEIFQINLNAEGIYEKCPVDQFLTYLASFAETHKDANIVVAAHNGGRFDTQFVYNRLLLRPEGDAVKGNPIKRGTNIIALTSFKNIMFKDTLNYCLLYTSPSPRDS